MYKNYIKGQHLRLEMLTINVLFSTNLSDERRVYAYVIGLVLFKTREVRTFRRIKIYRFLNLTVQQVIYSYVRILFKYDDFINFVYNLTCVSHIKISLRRDSP